MAGASVTVSASGPLFDGTASPMIHRWTREGGEEIAQFAEREVQRRLHQVLRHPTGHYESQVTVDRTSPDSFDITDNGVVYGKWLEGTSSRNEETRFKGYHTFREVKQRVEARADRSMQRILDRHAREL